MGKKLQKITKFLVLVCLCSLFTSFVVCAAETEKVNPTQKSTVKNGWVNKTYYYQNGEKLKNKWLKINKQKYYFDKNGRVVKGSAYVPLSNRSDDFKFFVFKGDGTLNVKKTKKCHAWARKEKDFTLLKKNLGKPIKASYKRYYGGNAGEICFKGVLEYKNFSVETMKVNGKEILMTLESKICKEGEYQYFMFQY